MFQCRFSVQLVHCVLLHMNRLIQTPMELMETMHGMMLRDFCMQQLTTETF